MAPWNKRQRLLVRWTLVSVLIVGCTVIVSLATRRSDEESVLPGAKVDGLTSVLSHQTSNDPEPIRFIDVTERLGIDFHHFPAVRASLLPEDMGSGVAVGDYDGDGYADLYFVNCSGNATPGSTLNRQEGSAKLYRNVQGRSFEDVTERAGVGFVGYGMGAAWGDYDNDGDLDLYVTAFGSNVLYQNRGDGTFVDVTSASGVDDPRFSAGCAWGDYDRDGDIDLYVSNYVDFVFRDQDRAVTQRQYDTEQPYTINPSAYSPSPNSLFRNNGDGTFTDVAVDAGVDNPTGRSLSASWADYNNDGYIDLYVANDVSNNGVFLNNRDGTFADVGPGSLAADYRGAMGIAVADFDDDLDLDLLITHWIAQENALYRNMTLDRKLGADPSGKLWFMDAADEHGLGQISIDMVGWATGFVDFDNDGARDLWLVNGSTLERAKDHRQLEPQRPFLFRNLGDGNFVEVGTKASTVFTQPIVGRGGARLDYNHDGLVDLVYVIHGGKAIVLKNVSVREGHWFRVSLRQAGQNTFALGARAYVTAGGRIRMAELGSSSSYLSQDEHVLHFGLGDVDDVDSLRIVWPDGDEETHEHPAVDRELVYRHGHR